MLYLLQMDSNLKFKSKKIFFPIVPLSVIFALAVKEIDWLEIWWKICGEELNYLQGSNYIFFYLLLFFHKMYFNFKFLTYVYV